MPNILRMTVQIFAMWSPGDFNAFWISSAIAFAREIFGVLSMSCSWAFRMSWRIASHVLCVIWQKKSSSSISPASSVFELKSPSTSRCWRVSSSRCPSQSVIIPSACDLQRQRHRGRYTSSALAASSYPFVGLPTRNTLYYNLFPSDNFSKSDYTFSMG